MPDFDSKVPFTRSTALAHQLTDDVLQSRRFRRIFHGVYISSDIPITTRVRAKAAILIAGSQAYVSHHTAAKLWGGWAPENPNTHVSSPGAINRTERRGLVAHRSNPAVTPLRRYGLPLAPPVTVFLELAAYGLSLVDLVAVGDSLVKAKRLTPQELIDAAARWRGAGSRRARRAAALVRPGVDSVMETRVRMLMVLARLPEPQLNLILRHEDGTWEYRIEIYYGAVLLAVEYEGRQHAESAKQWDRDIRRRTKLEARGWRFLLVTAEGVFGRPEETLSDIKSALRSRGVGVTARRPPMEWYREFIGEPAAV